MRGVVTGLMVMWRGVTGQHGDINTGCLVAEWLCNYFGFSG